jgi:hypothetical protein
VPGIPSILKIAEVHISHSAIRVKDNTHTDVTILLVLSVEGVSDDVITGFGVKGTDTQHLVRP